MIVTIINEIINCNNMTCILVNFQHCIGKVVSPYELIMNRIKQRLNEKNLWQFSSITSVPHAHLAICICDMRFSENKSGGHVMPVSIIRIYLLNDLYARALSIRLTPSVPNLMSPCAERGCSTFSFDIATKCYSTQLCSIYLRISVTIK